MTAFAQQPSGSERPRVVTWPRPAKSLAVQESIAQTSLMPHLVPELPRFNCQSLLIQALTHRSLVRENPRLGEDNERLEFLGDAILTFVSGAYLYRRFPDLGEDEMTRRRSALVDEKQLAQFAIALNLGQQLRMSRGVEQMGGRHNPNLLSSAFEALVGAYYLDQHGDVEIVRPFVEALFDAVPIEELQARSSLDVKNQLQEWAHKCGLSLPKYNTQKIAGQDHNPLFSCQVSLGSRILGTGQGRSKKEAEKSAAAAALETLNQKATSSTNAPRAALA
ncbi:MAG: ribonuclease III [Limnothrix sp.]|uniref:ribonuclease III n=2 Tax=unclassified Limnothrix TaxID=2632864 RepID=UPI000ACD4409|nr:MULTISPECIES: ribonuclease III [unclassified Limnothrix]MEB3117891.1 ribonuclease III [Limnothrix sp.]